MKFFPATYPAILKRLYPHRLSRLYSPKTIYLTFDDGPIPEVTPWVLEKLKEFNAKATFFCIGDNIRKHPDVFKQILLEGHQVGDHTFNHLSGWNTSREDYIENSLEAEKQIENYAGYRKQKLFRPPYGRIRNSQARSLSEMGYKIVMWDVLSGDFSSKISEEECFQNVIRNAKEGSIIVFHDSLKAKRNLEASLPRVLEFYSKKGWSFEKL